MAEKFTPPPGSIGCLGIAFVVSTGLTIGLTYRFAHTLNPFVVISTGTTGQVVTIAVCGVIGALTALQLLGLWVLSLASRRIDPRLIALVNCAIVGLIILALSYNFTGLLNPIESFRLIKGGRLVALIGTSILFGLSLLYLLFWLVTIGRIEASTRGSFWDARCRFCNQPVCQMTFQTGPPVKCGHCQEWVHSAHWAANGGNPMRRCPGCPQSQGRGGLDDFLKEFRDRM